MCQMFIDVFQFSSFACFDDSLHHVSKYIDQPIKIAVDNMTAMITFLFSICNLSILRSQCPSTCTRNSLYGALLRIFGVQARIKWLITVLTTALITVSITGLLTVWSAFENFLHPDYKKTKLMFQLLDYLLYQSLHELLYGALFWGLLACRRESND